MRKLLLIITALFAFSLLSHVFADTIFIGNMGGNQENPPIDTPGGGLCVTVLNDAQTQLIVIASAYNIESGITASHIHRAPPGTNGPVIFGLTGPDFENPVVRTWEIPKDMVVSLMEGNLYCNVHSMTHGNGEIRGQLEPMGK